MATKPNKISQKKRIEYICYNCDYITCNKFDYNKHLLTRRHKILNSTNENTNKNIANEIITYNCICGKNYKHQSSLCNHKKKCRIMLEQNQDSIIEISEDTQFHNTINYDKIILELINQNKELQKTINDMIPKIGNNITGNGNIIVGTMNNINLLNEKCKDALTMDDFIKMIKVDVNDLVYTSKKGLVQGVSQLFLEHYNSLPIIKRPLWCVDKKRKKLLIKEQEWLEDTDLKKTKEAMKNIGVIQAKNTNKYKNENPDWFENDKKKDMYISIIKQTTDVLDDKLDKIVNHITDTIHLTDDIKDQMQQ